MALPPPKEAAPTTVISLTPDLLLAIFKHLALKDVLNARLACSHFRLAGALTISSICCINGELLPGIFTTFPCIIAVKLILEFREGLSKEQLAERLAAFGHALPQAVESLTVTLRRQDGSSDFRRDDWTLFHLLHSLETFICQTLPRSTCADTLKRVHVSHISGPGAQRLLQLLSSAIDVELSVLAGRYSYSRQHTNTTITSFPPSLERFVIKTQVKVDMAKLARCSKLQHLKVDESCNISEPLIINLSKGLAGCTSLNYLDIFYLRSPIGELGSGTAAPAWLDSLQQLTTMRAPEHLTTSSPLWRSISKLHALTHLETRYLAIDSAAVPAASITHLTGVWTLDVSRLPADQPLKGLLTRLLPGLQELRISGEYVREFGEGLPVECVCLLHGHEHVRVVDASPSCHEGVAGALWRPAHSMPHLQVYKMRGIGAVCLDGMLGELAGCAELQEVYLLSNAAGAAADDGWYHVVTAPGLLQLATGACKDSLCSVRLEADSGAVATGRQGGAPVAALAGLLHGGLPELSDVQLDVQLQRSDKAVYNSHWKMVKHRKLRSDWDVGGLMAEVYAGLQRELSEHGVQLAEVAYAADEGREFVGFGHITVTGRMGGCAVQLRVWDACKPPVAV